MTLFRKYLLIGIATFGLGAASISAHADRHQMPGHHMGGPGGMEEHGRFGERMKEHMARRATELHDKLRLNTSQDAAWNTYMAKIKPSEAPERPDRAALEKMNAPQRLEQMLAHLKEREKHLADRIVATKEFYAVLTPEQKKIFDDAFLPRSKHHGSTR